MADTFLHGYLSDDQGHLNEDRKTAITFGVAVENLVHLVWRNEQIIGKNRLAEFPNTGEEIKQLNLRIRDIFEKTQVA